jgi:predicted RNA-binding protein with PIN domain
LPYLLDGNNLIGRERGGPASREDRDALVREVSDRLRATQARVVVFFDGAGDPVSLGNLSVRFAATGTADDAILREIARSARPQEITVVTEDRNLARRARDAGARTSEPRDFWKRFGAGTRTSPAPGGERVDVDDWMQWFSDERNREE